MTKNEGQQDDLTCQWCDEPITAADRLSAHVYANGQGVHYECSLRSAVGSVGHQMRRCSCYGGDQEDPPGTTRRQAAHAAAAYFILGAPRVPPGL